MVQIAGSYHDLGDYAKVELFSAKAKSTLEADGLTKCYAFARALNILALCFDQKGDFADAENVSRTALSVYHCCVSKDHFAIGEELSNLGGYCCEQSKFEEAESFLQQALQVELSSLPA
jgi:Tfp pilus assembly protein PilF